MDAPTNPTPAVIAQPTTGEHRSFRWRLTVKGPERHRPQRFHLVAATRWMVHDLGNDVAQNVTKGRDTLLIERVLRPFVFEVSTRPTHFLPLLTVCL
jgi:hypothetical protein